MGTGSGFQSSLLSRIVKKAYTIEIITALGDKVKNIFAPLGYDNIESRVGDGFFGWPEVEGGFDIILVTAQAPFVPPALLAQLKKGGRMIIPIGQPWKPQFLYMFTKDAQGKVHSQRDVATLFIPMTGQIQTPPPRPDALMSQRRGRWPPFSSSRCSGSPSRRSSAGTSPSPSSPTTATGSSPWRSWGIPSAESS